MQVDERVAAKNDHEDRVMLGARIRAARKTMSMTLEDVAQSVGVTRSFLSQVERGITSPSVTTLRRIASKLRIPVFLLFADDNFSPNVVVRRSERRILTLPKSTTTYQLLSPDLNRKIEMILTELEPGCSSCDEPLSHSGEECAYMLAGKVCVEVGDSEFILEQGDSLYFDCGLPHRITNLGDNLARIVSAISPPSF